MCSKLKTTKESDRNKLDVQEKQRVGDCVYVRQAPGNERRAEETNHKAGWRKRRRDSRVTGVAKRVWTLRSPR
ncbi:hypothetical protein MHYP_G00305610 [Metynnis hypsauchen]